MVIRRGEIRWVDLGPAEGSAPAHRRPVLIVQDNAFNASRIGTTIGAVLTTNQRLAAAPGNVTLRKAESGLPKDSVVNVSQIVTLDKRDVSETVSTVPHHVMESVTSGLRLVLGIVA